ncbi:unnamed protein product [Schistosoma turkestanicum]|nr:unnamed protein product [Schistosoma turkestanicum]
MTSDFVEKSSYDLENKHTDNENKESWQYVKGSVEELEITEEFNNSNLDECILPKLSRSDVNWYRFKFHENLFLITLKNGYHKTYSKLFKLIDYEMKQQQQLNTPGTSSSSSTQWFNQPLTERHDLLCEMMTHLMNAENFHRSNQIEEVYKEYLYLAGLFRSNINDQWLLEIFLKKCLKIANKGYVAMKNLISIKKEIYNIDATEYDILKEIKQSLKKRLFEAIYHNAMYLNETGNYSQSLILFKELQHRLDKHKHLLEPSINPFEIEEYNDNDNNNNRPLLYIVCYEQICKIILTIYQSNNEDYQMNELLENLNEALQYAEQSGNQKLVALCHKQIGQVYQYYKEYELAYKCAEKYFQIIDRSNDILEKIEAYKLLGSINENSSKLDEAEQNYINVVECTKLLNDSDSNKLAEAYELLAKFYILNTTQYELAKLACENGLKYTQTNESYIYNQLKFWYSMSKAKIMEPHYLNVLVAAQSSSPDIIDLIKWKDTRHSLPVFDKDHFMEVTYDSFTKRQDVINQTNSTENSNL